MSHTERIMNSQLSDPVMVRRMDFTRRWKQLRDDLDIKGVHGIAGKGSPHFFRLTMRKHLPVAHVAKVEAPGHPEDVMLEVKHFMASDKLSQNIQVVSPAQDPCPNFPSEVLPRHAISVAQQRGLDKFIQLMHVHHPERIEAVRYLSEWMGRCNHDGLSPLRRLRFLGSPRDFDMLPNRAERPTDLHHEYAVKHVQVTRKVAKRARGELVALPDFAAYLCHREAQGASRGKAQLEFNGMALLHEAAVVHE